METVTKQPILIKPNKWWIVVEDKDGYPTDKFITTKKYYKRYCEEKFEEFLTKEKAGKIKLEKL